MKIHGQELKNMTSFKMRGASILTRERRISSPFGGLTAQSLWVLPFGERSAPPAQPLAALFPLRTKDKSSARVARDTKALIVLFLLRCAQHKSKQPRCARTRAWLVMLGVAPLAQKRTRAMHKSILCEASMRGVHA